MRRATWGLALALAGVLALSGCWARVPGSATPSTPSAARMDCADPIAESAAVASGMRPVLDVVAFTTSSAQPVAEGGGLWVKTGIQLRSGARFELRALTPGMTMIWSNTGDDRFASRLLVPGCTRAGTDTATGVGAWLTYPGGFRLNAPVCAEIEVIVGERSALARVPLGADC